MFIDRLLATLVHLRHLRQGVTGDVLACWFGVSRATITRAVSEVRLLAKRGCTVPGGLRLRTPANVVAHLGARGQLGPLNATEVRLRRPAAGRAGRRRFVSGKARANTVQALVITDAAGRLLFCGQTRPGSVHDLTRSASRRSPVDPLRDHDHRRSLADPHDLVRSGRTTDG